MLDRFARDKLIATISEYLEDAITAFTFDDRIADIRAETADETVSLTVDTLWFLYDDCKDHKVVLSKDEWNFVQRLLLLLQSDSHVRAVCHSRWSWYQAIALGGLIGFFALLFGLGMSYWPIAIAFGILSIALSLIYDREKDRAGSREIALTPFASFGEIRATLRRAPSFCKHRYPHRLADRRIRSNFAELVMSIPTYAFWLLASPVILLFQALPDDEVTHQVEAA